MENALPPLFKGIAQFATRNRADKVSKKIKDLTHPTFINTQKVVHTCGSLGLTAYYQLLSCKRSGFSGDFLFLLLTILKTAVTSAFNNL